MKAETKKTTVEHFLRNHQTSIASVVPKGVSPERIIKTVAVLVATTPVSKTPGFSLKDCTHESVFLAVMRGCELGLSFNPALGEAYLVPRGGLACFQAGYRGLTKLALESDRVLDVEAHVVREGDDFDYEMGLTPRLSHLPSLEATDGKITHAYAIARLVGGFIRLEVMGRATLEMIRDKYAAKGSQLWNDHFDEAACKTVLRRICKKIPMSSKLADAFNAEDEGDVIEVDSTPPRASLTDKLAAKAKGDA